MPANVNLTLPSTAVQNATGHVEAHNAIIAALQALATATSGAALPADIASAITALNLGSAATHAASDFASPTQVQTAITALNLGTASTHPASDFAIPAQVQTARTIPNLIVGTLDSVGTNAIQEASVGWRQAMQEFSWAQLQPSSASAVDSGQLTFKQQELALLKGAHRQVTLELGTHNPPSWLAVPAYKAEDNTTTAQFDYTFSQTARNAMQAYIDLIHGYFDLKSYETIRLGSGNQVELLYPGGNNHYWGFSAAALGSSDLATGQTVNPFPNWRPGGSDHSITTAQVYQWVQWYVGSLVQNLKWRITYLRSKGFTGWIEVCIPGSGVRPDRVTTLVNGYLPLDSVLSVGAVWQMVVPSLVAIGDNKIRLHITSAGDTSGTPADNVELPTDQAANVNDSSLDSWSSQRWLSYLGKQNRLPISMESVGYTTGIAAHYSDLTSTGELAAVTAQIAATRPDRFYWAHSSRLYDGTIPFANVAAALTPMLTPSANSVLSAAIDDRNERLAGVPWMTGALNSGWNAQTGHNVPGYRRTGGRLELKGAVDGPAIAQGASATVMYLQQGFWPANNPIAGTFDVGNGIVATVTVTNAGTVVVNAVTGAIPALYTISLEGMSVVLAG